MSKLLGDKKRMLKEFIRELHAGAQPDKVKERFKEALKDIGPLRSQK